MTGAEMHEVTWTHEDGRLVGRIRCSAAHGAPCRLGCFAEDLDERCDDRDHAHTLADVGHCALVAAVERRGVLALYDGPSGEPLRSGPVAVQRDAHGWVWSYPSVEPARRLPARDQRASAA